VAQESNSHSETHQVGGGALYVVATPLGNLGDITLRALETLKKVDVIAAEDTRHTRPMLLHYGISTRLFALHEHNERAASARIVDWLREGKSVALVSDAGTPAISDPGALLVRRVREAQFSIVPIPGPSAPIAALSISGLTGAGFRFIGFLAAKPGARRAALGRLALSEDPLVFFEAPHRIVETMQDIAQTLGPERGVLLCRELTKRFETVHRCRADEAVAWLRADEKRRLGEFVVIADGRQAVEPDADLAGVRNTVAVLLEELPLKQAVALAAKITGAKRNTVYTMALEMQVEPKK
jgi:16S rRNA (cytidine1402-2'-O)-methyltransferase